MIETISLEELKLEIKDMLAICFEGKIVADDTMIYMILPTGQRFCVSVGEAAA